MALIAALLVVALCAITAAAMAARQQIEIRRTANIVNGDQAYWFALGVETWARQVLARDRADGNVDDLTEDWATVLPPIAVEGGMVAGRIEDLQGRFNLNNLVAAGKIDPNAVERFQHLLKALDVPVELAWAVADWIDADIDPDIRGGAEDIEYLGRELPYRTANAPMVSISELLLVKGITREIYVRLAPLVCALPKETALNVNTASAEVLASLADNLSSTAIDTAISARKNNPFENVEEFVDQLKAAGVSQDTIGKIDRGALAVASDHFLVTANARFGRGETYLASILQRDSQGVTTVVRRGQTAL